MNHERHEQHEKRGEFSEVGKGNFRDFSAFRGSNLPDFVKLDSGNIKQPAVIFDERQ